MLQEPLLLITFFFILFVISMIVVRVDLRILTPETLKRDAISQIWYDLVEKEEQKRNIYKKLQNSATTPKEYEASYKELQKALEKLDEEVNAIKEKIQKIDIQVAEKLKELNSKGQARFNKLHSLCTEYVNAKGKDREEKGDSVANFTVEKQKEEAFIDEILREYL